MDDPREWPRAGRCGGLHARRLGPRAVPGRLQQPGPAPDTAHDARCGRPRRGRRTRRDLRVSRVPALCERWHREGLIAVVGGGAAIELLSMRDGAADAVAMYDDVCAVLAPLWSENFGARLRLATLALAALAEEAPRSPTAGRDEVRATARRLREDTERVIAAREKRPFQIEGRAWEARLRAEVLRLDWLLGERVDLGDMVARWREAADLFTTLAIAPRRLGHGPGLPPSCVRQVTRRGARRRQPWPGVWRTPWELPPAGGARRGPVGCRRRRPDAPGERDPGPGGVPGGAVPRSASSCSSPRRR